jgi:HAD superfamily hydrolase (TIGR01509 family)
MKKTILVDAINTFVNFNGEIYKEMHTLLNEYENKKIILTGANDEQIIKFGLDKMPYELFTLKHNPEKSDPSYYKLLLEKYKLETEQVIYFEHNEEAVKSALSVGIKTHHYDKDKKDLDSLKLFLNDNL